MHLWSVRLGDWLWVLWCIPVIHWQCRIHDTVSDCECECKCNTNSNTSNNTTLYSDLSDLSDCESLSDTRVFYWLSHSLRLMSDGEIESLIDTDSHSHSPTESVTQYSQSLWAWLWVWVTD